MRHLGYYWFKYEGEWTVAYWSSCWELPWLYTSKDDEDFDEIDERRIERQPIVDNSKHDIKPPTEEELSAMIHNPQPPHTNYFY